jgi:hypothetical protein
MYKSEYVGMTLKELVALDKEGRLVPYPGKYKSVRDGKWDEKYMKAFNGSEFLGDLFIFNLTQEGVYQIVEGKHRISLLLKFLKSLGGSESESFNNRELGIEVFKNFSIDDLDKIYLQANTMPLLKATQRRYWYIIQENRDLLEKLTAHDFFKNCYNLGYDTDMADWDCMEILLAFLQSGLVDADKATLPSSLEEFAAKKIPYDKDISDTAFSILSFMERVFGGQQYTCRAIDFCLMAIIVIDDKKYYPDKEEFTEGELQALYNEYLRMSYELEPCVILSPLAEENLEEISECLGLIIEKVRNGKTRF